MLGFLIYFIVLALVTFPVRMYIHVFQEAPIRLTSLYNLLASQTYTGKHYEELQAATSNEQNPTYQRRVHALVHEQGDLAAGQN